MNDDQNNKDSYLLVDLITACNQRVDEAREGMVSRIVCEVSCSNLGMLVEPLY